MKLIKISTLLFLTSCSNWKTGTVHLNRESRCSPIHVHLYYHDSGEWNCLYLKDSIYKWTDTMVLKYKTDKYQNIKRIKLCGIK